MGNYSSPCCTEHCNNSCCFGERTKALKDREFERPQGPYGEQGAYASFDQSSDGTDEKSEYPESDSSKLSAAAKIEILRQAFAEEYTEEDPDDANLS